LSREKGPEEKSFKMNDFAKSQKRAKMNGFVKSAAGKARKS